MKFTYDYLWRQLATVYEPAEARSIVRLVLESRFSLSATDVYCGKVETLSAAQDAELSAILCRLMLCEPVQYVLGTADFFNHSFIVRPGVLIPRPETEELVRRILTGIADCCSTDRSPAILDIGTGSGCIAVSLSLALPCAHVTAWDISDTAIAIARGNARRLGAEVDICHVDALHASCEQKLWDVIVSNPPYICCKEQREMHRNVLDYEPSEALFVPDSDPLLFYRAIADYARTALKDDGRLYFEINPLYADETKQMLCHRGFTVMVLKDDEGKQRFIACRL